jgi:formate--tetrahydrofolate ligase
VVALNLFDGDSQGELDIIYRVCAEEGVPCALSEVFSKGADGGVALAKLVCKVTEKKKADFKFLYREEDTTEHKIETVVREVYGGEGVSYDLTAKKAIKQINEMGLGNLPICIAKTQYSLSDNATLLGRPQGFTVNVRDVRLSAGAGFIVVITGDIMTMPGLPKKPSAQLIDIDKNGTISGLF